MSPASSLLGDLLAAPRAAPPETVLALLAASGVEQPAATAAFVRDGAAPLAAPARERLAALLDRACAGPIAVAPDAGLALRGLVGLVEAEQAEPHAGRAGALDEAAARPDALTRLTALLGQTRAATEAFVRDPEALLGALSAEPSDDGAVGHLAAIAAAIAEVGVDPDERATVLARYRHRRTLAILAREFVRGEPIERIGQAQSDLADAIIAAALALAVEAEAVDARPAQGLVVIALGKLGGRELNYSSDVDLLYVCDDRGLSPIEAAECQAEHARTARRLGQILSRQTAAGPIYRVDTRLRPEGRVGALVRGIESMGRYYRERGRAWERQALLKARPVAGDAALGEAFIAAVEPFVYGPPLTSEGIRQILGLREQVRQRARTGGLGAEGDAAAADVKEGPGGIRDVESCVQFLQLLGGGDDPRVRSHSTLDAALRLQRAETITEAERRVLADAYTLQRRVEHALQTERARESWSLPPPGADRRRLARRLGFADEAAFDARFVAVREQAAALARRLLEGLFGERVGEGATAPESDLVLESEPSRERKEQVLGGHGFADPEAAYRNLMDLGREQNRLLAGSQRARNFLAGLAPRLLAAVARTPDPDRTLLDLGRMAATLGAKATVLQLLAEDRDALELFVELASISEVLVEAICRYPGSFDEVLDRLRTARVTDAALLGRELEQAAARAADPERAIREARAIELLLIGIRDIGGKSNAANTMSDLSTLAEAVLRARLTLSRGEGERDDAGFCVLAVGRLASSELLYASDLDLVFVTDAERAGLEPAEAAVRFGARAARLTRLSEGGAAALLPNPIDARLRPAGTKGPIATAFGALRDYHTGKSTPSARLWERLAFTRGRAVAGDPELGAAVEAMLRETLPGRDDPAEVWRETLDMRRRQAESARGDDIKVGPGGLADIEFLAAALALTHGREHPDLLRPHTVDRLNAALKAGRIGRSEHGELITGYQLLTRVLLRRRLSAGRTVNRLPKQPKLERRLALMLRYTDTRSRTAEQSFKAELGYHRERVAHTLKQIAEREGSASS